MKLTTPLSLLLFLLGFLCLSCTTAEQRQRMAQVIAEADSLNRHYIPMTCDSLLLQACHYYDRHGTPNERMRAHYLLGCTYRDMQQAPQALECYQDAIDAADTTAVDCDYRLMMSINGQMAELFHAQNLPQDELASLKAAQICALKEKDTLNYILSYELQMKAYYLLRDTNKVVETIKNASSLFRKHGREKESYNSYGTLIHIYVNQGRLAEASHLIAEYESQSNCFDQSGNISKGREIYYYIKGNYFLKSGNLDSSEFYLRKALPYSKSNSSRGLLSIYQAKGNCDSVSKYARLYEEALDTLHNNMRTDVLHQTLALYDYHRFQKESEQKAREAFQTRLLYGGLAILLLLCLLCLLYRYRRLHEKHEAERMNYEKNLLALSIKEQENTILRKHEHDNKELIATNEEEIRRLKDLIKDYEQQRKPVLPAAPPELNNPVTFGIHQKAAKGCALDNRDWEEIEVACQTAYPGFTEKLHALGDRLDHTEYQICVLVKMRFMLSEISVLLSITSSVLSHKRKRMNGKLFQKEGSATDFDERIRSL